MTKIAFSGYTGFIGQYFGALLEEHDDDVLALLRQNKIANFKEKEGSHLSFVRLSQTDDDIIKALKGYDVFVHIAGKAHIKGKSAQDFQAFIPDNVDLTAKMANYCLQAGIKKFIFVSSIGVHGYTTSSRDPFSTTDVPAPITAYARSKLRAEEFLKDFCETHKITLVIVRPPLVYDRYAPGNIESLRKALLYKIPLPFGSIENKRSIVTAADLSKALLDACLKTTWDHSIMLPVSKTCSTADLVTDLANDIGEKAYLFSCPTKILKTLGKVSGKTYMIEQLIGDLEIDPNWTPSLIDSNKSEKAA